MIKFNALIFKENILAKDRVVAISHGTFKILFNLEAPRLKVIKNAKTRSARG